MKDINISAFLKKMKSGDFFRGCNMPMGYVADFPIISVIGEKPVLKVPFLRYKMTGEVDKTLVFPVKFVLTFSLPDMKPVAFEDLEYNKVFRKIDFTKPIGYFRHDAIKTLTKKDYAEHKAKLFTMYNQLATCVLEGQDFANDAEFKNLLGDLLEPSVKPIYKALDENFYNTYLA